MDNYLGKTIRDYYVESRIDKKKYKVRCINCNQEKELTMQTLRDGRNAKGNCCICQCTLSGIKPGDKFGRLTVLKRIPNLQYGRTSFECQCECGKKISVIAKNLKDGNIKSCGCLAKDTAIININKANINLENLIGKRSGKLIIIREATEKEKEYRPKGNRYWLCQCDCGNTHIVSTSDFNSNKVQSCGCMNSKGEALISSLLEENKIRYATQFFFEDLKGEKGRKYYFDFGILNENNKLLYLIEYDGIQHFDENHQFNNKNNIIGIKQRDNIKNDYCFKNNIPLIRIPYTKKNITIDDLKLETTQFLIKKESDANES